MLDNKNGNETFEDENNTSVLDDIVNGLKRFNDFIDKASEKLGHKMTFDEFLEVQGEYIDKRILLEVDKKKLTCYGGEFILTSSTKKSKKDDKRIEVIDSTVIVYFQDQDNKWIKSEFSGSTPFSKFNKNHDATLDMLNKLSNGETYKMNIEPPNKG